MRSWSKRGPSLRPVRPEATPRALVWLVFRAGAMAAYRLSSAWAIRADLGLGLALDPPAFEWTGAVAAVAFRPSVLSGRAALGAEVRF